MTKIAVLGSNSFSGASFVAQALKAGHDLIGISRSQEPTVAFLPYRWENGTLKFYQCDINNDREHIVSILEAFQPEVIVNFAAQSMVAESWQNPDHWYQTNVLGNVRLLESLRMLPYIKKYVHVSTPEVYGSCSGLVTEEAPYNPSTPYASSRAACDMHLMNLFKNYDFPVMFTRAANVYGPGQQLYRIIPRTMLYIKLGRKLQLHGGGLSVRSFIHARDVAEGTLKVIEKGKAPHIYHLSTTHQISIRDLVHLICRRMQVDFNEFVEVTQERPGKDAAYLLSSQRAQEELGWEAKISLEEGLEETYFWIEKHLESLKQESLEYVHKE